MNTTFSNDTVYPLPAQTMVDVNSGASYVNHENTGLTKREYFAAMAMQGLLAGKYCSSSLNAAGMAVQHADALIFELNKPIKL